MEGALEGDDRRPAGGAPRELDRGLDGLRPRIAEEDRVERLGERRWAWTAAVTAGCPWPRIVVAMPVAKSR